MKTIHALISGKVQGVFFRQSTQKKARQLSISGWVKNLTDGRVELMATGDDANIAAFCAWLKQGPRLASVDAVAIHDVETQPFVEFSVRRE